MTAEAPPTALELAVAEAFIAGFSIIPPRQDGTKAPRGSSWTQYQQSRADRDQLRAWYRGGRSSGLGLVCGAVSGGLEVLEFEGRAVAAGMFDDFIRLAEASGLGDVLARIRAGYTESTPSGGVHLLYHVSTALPNVKLACRPATPDELAIKPRDDKKVLIETRGEGGYVIVAPSNGKIHPSGGRWERVAGSFATLATITTDERDALFELGRTFDRMPVAPPRVPVAAHIGGDRPGDRYNERPDIGAVTLELLERHGWTRVYSKAGTDYLRRPGKDGPGTSATLGYVGPGVLRVFSTACADFDEGAHSPFAVLTALEFGGDYSAAARSLVEPSVPLILDDTPTVAAGRDGADGRDDPAPEEVEVEPGTAWPAPPDEVAYHGVLGEMALRIAPHTEADPVGILAGLLTMFGVACGRYRYIYQGAAHSPNLFVVLVGETAHARKGTALGIARDVMTAAYPGWRSMLVPGLGSGEGLVGWLARRDGSDPEVRTEHRALVMVDEFGGPLTTMNRQGSILSTMLREGWDGVPMGRTLAREDAMVAFHHVAILSSITPVELRDKLADVDAANGFANRALWVAVRRTALVPFPESPVARLGDLIRPLHQAIIEAQDPGELHWTPDAADLWEAVYAGFASRPTFGMVRSVTARAEAQTVRLALTFALADRAPAIGVDHLEAARALVDYVERSVVWTFGDSTGDRHADALRRMLRDGPISWEDAKRALNLRYAADMDQVARVLIDAGLAEVLVARQGRGRPRRVIRAVTR